MNKVRRFLKNHGWLVLIVAIGLYLRVYDFTNRISLGLDSSRDAFVSLEGARQLQLPITGPFISIAPVTTGPWYWIQLILARLILPTPYAPWLLLTIYSVLMIVIMYAIGKRLESHVFGLMLALITALSPNQISNATALTNPSVIGFYTSLVVLIFLVLLKKGPQSRLGLIWGLMLGITINTHYQTIGLMSMVGLLLYFKKRYLKTIVYTLIGVGVTFLPLLIFELNNHWFNTRHMLQYILVEQYKIWVPMRWLTYIKDFWPDFTAYVIGGTKNFAAVVLIAITISFITAYLTKRLKKEYVFLFISFAIQVIIIRYYRGERFFGYLQFFHPFLFIFLGLTFWQLYQLKYGKIICLILFSVCLTMIYPTIADRLRPSDLTAETNAIARDIYTHYPNQSISLYKCRNTVRDQIIALVLKLTLDNSYRNSARPLGYIWDCSYPLVEVKGQIVQAQKLANPDTLFPKINWTIMDLSEATPAARTQAGWVEITPESLYQSAARWWMDEQP